MVDSDRPLLERDRPPSESSDDVAEEEDELLTGQHKAQEAKRGWAFWREVGAFAWAVIATAAVIVLAVLLQHRDTSTPKPADGSEANQPSGKRNLIFMVSDGMGPTSLSLTRSFRKVTEGELPDDDVLVLDRHHIGSSRTKSSTSFITDSAAGATAFSCGMKSYNGAISTLPDGTPCGTVLEAAKKAGYITGLVVTTRLTDATPACFASHVNLREEEDSIAQQLVGDHPLGHVVDLLFGGGRCHFLANTSDGSCRDDSTDVVQMAKDKGYSYIDSREGFDNLGTAAKLPLLGLFAPTDIPYELDRRNRDDEYPSLPEMAEKALKILAAATKDSDKGFFVMIEGSRIDHAGHANDPAAQVHEVLAYDATFARVLDFLDGDDVEGVAVSTSDHETGGLAVARQLHATYPEYLWHPSALANVSASSEVLARRLVQFNRSTPRSADERRAYAEKLVTKGLGIADASSQEIDRLVDAADELLVAYGFADMVSRRAQNGWSTHGHSAADVNIYASDPKQAAKLRGNHENTEVGHFLRDYLDLSLEDITEELKAAKDDGRLPDVAMDLPQWALGKDHYAGDFKRREIEQHGSWPHGTY